MKQADIVTEQNLTRTVMIF